MSKIESEILALLVDKRRKWLFENNIEDWTDSDTEFVAEDYAICFAEWYSGMSKNKVKTAYKRYLTESANQNTNV